MKAVGIDIGTTTVCGIVIDAENGEVLDVRTLDNPADLPGETWEHLQSPDRIADLAGAICREFTEKHSDVLSIGLTGQMHGVLFTDREGNAVSPLYTWQDERGNLPSESGRSYAEELSELTGYPMATGFGMTTCYVLTKEGRLPERSAHLATIPDYVGMKLTGRKEPVVTPSMGASLGCFDLKKREFDRERIAAAGIDLKLLPECRTGFVLLGTTPEGIPVSVAIGDNQASFTGSVRRPEESVLINVGTGSQVSTGIGSYLDAKHVELRPLDYGGYILVGSSLCGGRAYAALEKFFSEVLETFGAHKQEKLYDRMSELLEKNSKLPRTGTRMLADTRFCGTREDPSLTGSFTNVTLENLHPAVMTEAILKGIAEELTSYHRCMLDQGAQKPTMLIGSGNGIRLNPWLRKIFEEIYGLPMQIPVFREEAAFGAALYGLCAAGVKSGFEEAIELIRYE